MPDIGEGIAEVELVAWHVKPGDTVKEDQVLADVMTDKATVEIPSPVSGKVVSLGGKVGRADGRRHRTDPPRSGRRGQRERRCAARCAQESGGGCAIARTRASPAPPRRSPRRSAAVKRRDPRAAPHTAATDPRPRRKPLASPAVRRRAWDLGIELQFVHGSGPAGRIMHEDLDVYLASRGQPAPRTGGGAYAERHEEETVAVIGLRRKIAQKMQESKRRIPHFSYVEEIDVTELEALRAQLNEQLRRPSAAS